jgi:hypothetical protein
MSGGGALGHGGKEAVRVREYVYACTCTLAAYTIQLYVERRFTRTCTPAAYTIQLYAGEQTYTYFRTLEAVPAWGYVDVLDGSGGKTQWRSSLHDFRLVTRYFIHAAVDVIDNFSWGLRGEL